MTIRKEDLEKKNLTINTGTEKKENILSHELKNQIIQQDIADNTKVLYKDKIINTQKVSTGLRAEDAENLQDVLDMDLYKEYNITYENLPKYRLNKEKRILMKGPVHLKGCTKWWARKKWTWKQKSRVKAAEKLLKKHEKFIGGMDEKTHVKILGEYDKYKNEKLKDIEQITGNVTAYFADKEQQNQQNGDVAEMLNTVNESLTREALLNLNRQYNDSLHDVDVFLKNYVIDESTAEAERREQTAKDQAKRKKKAEKTGKEGADEELLQNREELENELLDRGEVKNRTLKTEVVDPQTGKNVVQLKDISDLFKKVLSDFEKPFTEEKEENGHTVQKDLSAQRYAEIAQNAQKVLGFATDLGIAVPEELYYIIKLEDNPLLKNGMEKFAPEKNARESYVLLMSAMSKVYYESLNRYAGYYVSDGLEKYHFSKDPERIARNFDILNMGLISKIRNIRDMTSAFANEIRKNRLKVYDETVPEDQIQDQNMRENIALIQGAQPTGLEEVKQEAKKEEKKEEETEEQKREKRHAEWKELLSKDIRGTVEVDKKDMKQTPWILKDYQQQVFNIMKNNPDCDKLTGEPLKRYLIAMNDNLRSNLMQLNDELPKTSVGAKFCYIPKLRDAFIEKIKTERFAMLLRPDFFYRELLRNNSILDDLLDKPAYKAAKNRQREIMKAINEELGLNFYTNVKHLETMWSNETMQNILLQEPQDKEEQESKAKEEILKKKEGEEKTGNVLNFAVQKLLSNSQSYGVSDKAFKDTIEKIKATVHDNIAVIDRKISLMGLCDTAKEVLKRNLIKRLGGEYLLGYNVISQEIVEYTIDNMMMFDGTAATIQRTWERKFARTGLPGRLSAKMERIVADKINANGKRDEYYLRPKGFKVSNKSKNKWEETNKKTNKVIESLKKLYNNDIKDFMKKYTESDELRQSVSNANLLYIGDKVKLTKKQWDQIEDYFENSWLTVFKDSYENGEYSAKDVKTKMKKVKEGLSKVINAQLTKNYDEREGLKKDTAALKEYEDTLISRDEFTDGLKKNVVIEEPKMIVTDDIRKQIFQDPALKEILKSKENRDIFTQVLGEELRDEKSALHAKLAYLDDVRSIEQLGNLGLIDYADFFAQLKSILCVTDTKNQGEQRLLLDEWRMRGQADADIFGVKKKLLKDFFTGQMTAETLAKNAEKYEKEATEASAVDMMRIDAMLNTEVNEEDTNVKFNYLNVVGKSVNQTDRIKKLSYAQRLWYRLQKADETKHVNGQDRLYVERFSKFTNFFFANLGVNIEEPKEIQKNIKKIITKIKELGKLFDKTVIREKKVEGKLSEYYMDPKLQQEFLKAGFLKSDRITARDGAMLKAVIDIFKELKAEDTAEKKMTFADCMGEILLFGCGKEYFEAGGVGEKTFLNSKDEQYYADIVITSNDFFKKRANIIEALNALKVPKDEANKILARLKPVIAGIKVSDDKKVIAENVRKYGVGSINQLIVKIAELYGEQDKAKAAERQAQSKKIAEIYKARRDYIDNYGTGFEHGKFKLVRDFMFRDREIWGKIMSLSDSEFVDYIEEQNRIYGKGLDVFSSADFRASGPINEQYVMSNWADFKNRADWDKDKWYTEINTYHDAFVNARIGKKSILEMQQDVEEKLDYEEKKEKKDKKEQLLSGRMTLWLEVLLNSDPAAFNILFHEKDMHDSYKRIDKQYKENVIILGKMMEQISIKASKNEAYSDNEEEDRLYKEAADLYFRGKGVEEIKKTIGSTAMLRKVEEKAKKENKPDENNLIYADYSLLMQLIRPCAFTMTSEQFKANLIKTIKDFKAAQLLDRNANIYSRRNVLDAKDAIRLELEIRKNEGRMLERQFNHELADYREKKSVLGSVGLVAYNADPKFDEKTVTKASSFVEKNFGGDFGSADEEFIKGLLTERAVAFGLKKEDDLKAVLDSEKVRLLSLDTALRKELGKEGPVDEDQIRRAIVFAFAQNANRTALPLDGTHEGDVKEILTELQERDAAINIKEPVSRIAKRDYEEFMEEMDIARFTMTKEEFREACDKKRRYFELVDAAVEKINAATDKPKEQLGLFDYFKKDIFEALAAEKKTEELTTSITEQLDKLIGDKTEGRNDLDAESIRQITLSYLPDSSALMQHIDDKTLTAEEKLMSSENCTRADVEKEIAMSGKKDLIKMYNNLTVEEQKVFAIALTFPDIGLTTNEKFTSNAAIRDKDKEYKKELEMQEQLAAFIYDQDFAPKIDYNLVMSRLMKTDRKTGFRRLSVTMFEKAYKYTQFCMMKKNEMRPKDFNMLSNGSLTGDVGRAFAGLMSQNERAKEALDSKQYYGAKTFREFFKNYGKEEAGQDKTVAKIIKKFESYNDVQINMLLHVLQDRTAIDYTTSAGYVSSFFLGGVAFVNEERREAIKNSFMRPDGMDHEFIAELNRSITHEMFDKAAETLFSFQLRDDKDLGKNGITESSFAKGALERKTTIDWQMLDRAMDLVKEIEEENLRIQLCRQTVEHTTDSSSPNVAARALGKEIKERFEDETTNHFGYFLDFLTREAKKNPKEAMPMISAFSGMSENERMLVVHALKHRDILDISTDGTFTTAIGQNENRYVNEIGRDQLADYYIDHFSTPGQKNVLATTQYDVRDAMKSLVSTQVSDARDAKNKKNFADMMEGKKILNWVYVGGRSTGVDWTLFGNALKFVKRTEGERKLLVGEAEQYRSAGDINKYGRFMYNYSFMRKNLYRSGFRATRFFGRRVRAELEGAIPGYGFGQRIMMMALSPKMKNKMLSSGIVVPAVSKNKTTEYLGYVGLGGSSAMSAGGALAMVSETAKSVTKIGGEALQQTASGITGLYNVVLDVKNIRNVNKPLENEAELQKERQEKNAKASKVQTEAQKMVTKDNQLNKDWILNEVGSVAVKSANARDIVETFTTFVNVMSGSSFGIQAFTNTFVGGIRAIVTETLHTARFIMSVCQDKKLIEKYFANEGPLGKEIQALRGENIQKIMDDQKLRDEKGSRELLKDAVLRKSEAEFMENMSNAELFRKAYGFKDFSEQAAFVGWNIVQTLLQATSPFGTDPVQFMKASLLLAAIGCKDVIGKQDNESAQKVYDRLMGKDIR